MGKFKQVIIWGIITILVLGACRLFSASPTTSEEQIIEHPTQEAFTIVEIEYSETPLDELLQLEVQKARNKEQRPYVEFYADWCAPCVALRKSLNDERMIDAFAGTYIIQLNLDEWGDEASRKGFNVPAIPLFFELDAAGNPTGRTINGGAWGEDIPENMAPPLKTFFQEGKR